MNKKIGGIFLVLVFILLATFHAVAAEQRTIETDTSEFIIEDGVLIGYQGDDEVVTIPEDVKKIGESVFYFNSTVKQVNLPEGIKEIGEWAFGSATIEEINFPESLEYVGPYAFSGSALKTVTASEGFEFECGRCAFQGCSQYDVNDGFFIIGNVLAEGNSVHSNNGILVIPDGITIIAPFAFSNNLVGIKEVILPESIKVIGDAAFYNMISLRKISFPEGLEYIGNSAFARTWLNDITIPDSVTYIGNNAFLDERNGELTFRGKTGSVTQSYAKENGHIFYPTNMSDFQVEDNVLVKYLGTDTEVTIPDGIIEVADSAFADNTFITKVTIPEGVAIVGQKAFQNCVNLSEVNLPDSVIMIGYASFDGCESLERLTLPVGIQGLTNCIFAEVEYDLLEGTATFGESFIKELAFLNPDFEIAFELLDMPLWTECLTNLEVVYGYAGGYGETLAEQQGATFIPLEENLETLAANYSNTLKYLGDVNQDGEVSAEDALTILRHVVKLEQLAMEQCGEIDGVEGITAADALQVLRYVVKLDDKVIGKPNAYETYQFAANGRFQGLSDEVMNQTEIIESKEELDAFMEEVYGQYCTTSNEEEFALVKSHFELLDEAYFEENVCVVTVDTGKLGWGRYTADTLTNLDTYVEGEKVYRRGLVLNYEVGTDTPISSTGENSPYILVSSTTIPKEALKGAVLVEVIK